MLKGAPARLPAGISRSSLIIHRHRHSPCTALTRTPCSLAYLSPRYPQHPPLELLVPPPVLWL
eukprot:scaffold3143_cov104-Isochrysis_galbana.AAC.1